MAFRRARSLDNTLPKFLVFDRNVSLFSVVCWAGDIRHKIQEQDAEGMELNFGKILRPVNSYTICTYNIGVGSKQ